MQASVPNLMGNLQARLGGMISNLSRSGRSTARAYATGGEVSNMDISDFGRLELQVAGQAFPVLAKQNVAEELKNALTRERMMRSN